jgi:hypothetical protein
MACRTALWQYPSDMLHAVLNKTTGHLMETQHLLVNPKYKELWGKSYTEELGRLAQDNPRVSKCTNTSYSSAAWTFHMTANTMSHTHKSV